MKKIKKLSAFIIALCMIVSIVPMNVPEIAVKAADTDIVLDFTGATADNPDAGDSNNWTLNTTLSNPESYQGATLNMPQWAVGVNRRVAVDVNVPEAGWYTADVVIGRDEYYFGGSFDLYVNSETADNKASHIASRSSAEATDVRGYMVEGTNAVYLNAGTNTVIFKGVGYNAGGQRCWLVPKTVTLKTAAAPAAENIEYILTSTATGVTRGGYSRDNLAQAMDINEAGWKLNAEKSTEGEGDAYLVEDYFVWNIGRNGTIAIDINVKIPGHYTGKVVLNSLDAEFAGNFDVYLYDSVTGQETYFGKITGNGVETVREVIEITTFNTIYVNCGIHTLLFKSTDDNAAGWGRNQHYFKSISLIATNAPDEIPSSEVFGDRYAYVTVNGDGTYDISFIGGLKNINFANAGFEVWVGEEKKADILAGGKVYKEIIAGGNLCSADYYGGEYIFVATYEGIAADETITVKPFVIDENETKTYHGESFTLSLTI